MKIFLSPAKRLDLNQQFLTKTSTEPRFIEKAEVIMDTLRKKSPENLMQMQKISEELADLNYKRNQEWSAKPPKADALQTGLMFDGEVYRGLRETELTAKEITYLKKNLYILSGLYGILRLTDKVMPYRLEMGTDISVGSNKNLYAFWTETLTEFVNAETKKGEILLDLSSKEYISVLDKTKLKGKFLDVKFMDMHSGKLKQITVYFKQARGLMTHFCATNNVKTLDELKHFDGMGYVYDDNLSTDSTLIFTR